MSKRGSPSQETPWSIRHREAKDFGYSGTLDDYVSLYNYVRQLRLLLARDSLCVSPSRVNGWGVRPLPAPAQDEVTILDTFRVQRLDVKAACQSGRDSSPAFSSELWLEAIKARIERELSSSRESWSHFYRQREATLDTEVRRRREQTLEPTGARPVLPAEAHQLLKQKLRLKEDSVVISKFGIDFCCRDLATLRSPHWLNDEVINFYMQLLLERSERRQDQGQSQVLPSLHIFSSFFYPKLRDRGHGGVKSATRRHSPSVLARDLILFPIHLGMHWCLVAVDFRRKSITYYDSLHGSNADCLRTIRGWLGGESKDKLGNDFDFTGWTEACPTAIPAQQNGYDCGVFSLVFAEHLCRDAPLVFSQGDMHYWRDRISYEIISGTLLDSTES